MIRFASAFVALLLCAAQARAAYMPSGPPVAVTITSAQIQGTAFQPCTLQACQMNVVTTLGGVLALTTVVTIAESPSSGGTYTTVASFSINALAASSFTNTTTVFVPKGYWMKITVSNITNLLSSLSMSGATWTLQ